MFLLRRLDLNQRPTAYEAAELPTALLHKVTFSLILFSLKSTSHPYNFNSFSLATFSIVFRAAFTSSFPGESFNITSKHFRCFIRQVRSLPQLLNNRPYRDYRLYCNSCYFIFIRLLHRCTYYIHVFTLALMNY